MKLTGEIRRLVWGVIPSSVSVPMPTFNIAVDQAVGGRIPTMIVTQIVREFTVSGIASEYHIECVTVDAKGVKGTIPFIWKTYFKEPDIVEYFLPDEKHDYLKI